MSTNASASSTEAPMLMLRSGSAFKNTRKSADCQRATDEIVRTLAWLPSMVLRASIMLEGMVG
eukprot:scaffold146100_cov46-Tisochrysis_lutea.AAC.2